MPTERASRGPWKCTALPSSWISPALGGKLPAMSFTSVDLPAPLSPISPRISPDPSARSTCVSASIAPNRLVMPRSSSNATFPPALFLGAKVGRSSDKIQLRALLRKGQGERAGLSEPVAILEVEVGQRRRADH